MHELAQKLCHFIRHTELLHPGDRVGVAVSGGPDSVALLRVLQELREELGIVLSVVHVNHKLRGAESDTDADFVCALAREHKLQFHGSVADVAQHASERGISIETAARELRYKFFRELLGESTGTNPQELKPPDFPATTGTAEAVPSPDRLTSSSSVRSPGAVSVPCPPALTPDFVSGPRPSVPSSDSFTDMRQAARIRGTSLDKIVTGHTLDDQAETVLMRVIRGTGMRGLRAIQPCIFVETDHGTAEIVRPLLQVRRGELQAYLNDIGQNWREDATNRDPKFTRNRVRQVLMPLLEREFNPAVQERLAELAEIARAEEEFWESEADGWLGTGIQKVQPQTAASQLVQLAPVGGSAQFSIPAGGATNLLLDLAWLLSEETAVQRRIIKAAAGEAGLVLDFQHIEEVLRFAAQEGSVGKELFLPGGWKVLCGEDALELVAPHLTIADAEKTDYELRLPIPGEVIIAQTGSRLQAIVLQGEDQLPANANPEHLFDAALLNEFLTVRNWRPGDRFWPAHSKSPKKIKELLQQRHVPQAERARWPVILSRDELIWVRGFPGRAHMRPGEGKPAVLIREQPPKERV